VDYASGEPFEREIGNNHSLVHSMICLNILISIRWTSEKDICCLWSRRQKPRIIRMYELDECQTVMTFWSLHRTAGLRFSPSHGKPYIRCSINF
jgi:hypothetical protein